MDELHLKSLNKEFINKKPQKIIERIIHKLGVSRLVLASSLSIEDQVLTHMMVSSNPQSRIFFIDTGRHFEKTYNLMEETMKRYGLHYEIYAPSQEDIETITSLEGPNFFYKSIEQRKKCCDIRKVKPLKKVLNGADGWITGLRRDQSITRQNIEILEWDDIHEIYKINPIAFWSEEDVWNFIKKENIPYSSLYHDGFRSIGCQPCTRAVNLNDDVRSGRWWWENYDKRECGLHFSKEGNS